MTSSSPLRMSLYTIMEEGSCDPFEITQSSLSVQEAVCMNPSNGLNITTKSPQCTHHRCYVLSRFLSTNALVVLLLLVCIAVPPCLRTDFRYSRILSLRRVIVDAVGTNGRAPTRTVLFDDGTLFMPQHGESMCQYFLDPSRSHTEIKRIHYHLNRCSDDDDDDDVDALESQLSEYIGASLLATAAGVPLTMTCGISFDTRNGGQETILSRLMDNAAVMEPTSLGVHGRWTPLTVCQTTSASFPSGHSINVPGLSVETIQQIMQNIIYRKGEESMMGSDAVLYLQFGNDVTTEMENGILPHRAYSDAIHQAVLEKGKMETMTIVIRILHATDQLLAHRYRIAVNDLVVHLEQEFPMASIETINAVDESTRKVFQRLMTAKKVAICGVSSVCAFPVVSNRHGIAFLYQWPISDNAWETAVSNLDTNVRMMEAPLLTSHRISSLSDNELLQWLQSQHPIVVSSDHDGTAFSDV